jgi:hypothetical protein
VTARTLTRNGCDKPATRTHERTLGTAQAQPSPLLTTGSPGYCGLRPKLRGSTGRDHRRAAGRDEKTKKFSWPAYLANALRETGCDSAFLIVVCPDPAEAKGCREVIPLGHPGLELWPIVIDPEHAPDGEDAGPYLLLFLACLPALDMENPAVARRVLTAIRDTGASYAERKTLSTIILVRASEAARRLLEGMMQTMEWKSDFIESYEERGLEQGSLTTKRKDVLKVLDVRRLRPTDAQRAQVGASTDLAQLDLWFERSLTAATAADVFKD